MVDLDEPSRIQSLLCSESNSSLESYIDRTTDDDIRSVPIMVHYS